jgi:superfamily II RNA helicase
VAAAAVHGDAEGEFTVAQRKPGSQKLDFVPLSVAGTVRRETTETCVHEVPELDSDKSVTPTHCGQVAVPPGFTYVPFNEGVPFPTKMAKEYKFTLDPFQRQSVWCIERNESVMVSAHTSAGKTVRARWIVCG